MYKVGLVGCGRWGPNLLRNFHNHRLFEVAWVCDCAEQMRQKIVAQYPQLLAGSDFGEMLASYPVDIAVIATPLSTHFALAKQALQSGCHVFIEKPLAPTAEECRQLISLAESKHRLLFTDFTYAYHPEILFIQEQVHNGYLGERLLTYQSRRVNWGPVRRDINAIGDLAVHDFSVLHLLHPQPPLSVSATGSSFVEGEPVNLAFIDVTYPDGFSAHINVNWYSPRKLRNLVLSGNQRIISYDELSSHNRLLVYDCRLPSREELPTIDSLNQGMRLWAPEFSINEPLRLVVENFARCLDSGDMASDNHALCLLVARLLDAANASLERNGDAVDVEPE